MRSVIPCLLLLLGCDPAPGKKASPAPPARPSTVLTFDGDAVGSIAPSFEGRTGAWTVVEHDGHRALQIDGGKGEIDGLLAVLRQGAPPGNVRVSVRFQALDGAIDQAAGIAFAIGEGSYLAVRANALEGGLALFKFVSGKRKIIENLRDVPVSSKAWHTLSIELRGAKLDVFLDGQRKLERTLDAAPSGALGLWSRADSKVVFDDFTVTPL